MAYERQIQALGELRGRRCRGVVASGATACPCVPGG
jgi:hypothetical protein